MSASVNYYLRYTELPPKDRKWVLHTLAHWAGWTRTTVYRKLQCKNLTPVESVLVNGVLSAVLIPRIDGKQLVIEFDWEGDQFRSNVRLK